MKEQSTSSSYCLTNCSGLSWRQLVRLIEEPSRLLQERRSAEGERREVARRRRRRSNRCVFGGVQPCWKGGVSVSSAEGC